MIDPEATRVANVTSVMMKPPLGIEIICEVDGKYAQLVVSPKMFAKVLNAWLAQQDLVTMEAVSLDD